MSRPTLNLVIALENVHCYDEGDGWGDAEPYLWPVFFKIDGDTYAVETGAGLIGFPTIESRNGHHGNLDDTDVDEGDDVPIPEGLGTWRDTLKPIPINDPLIRTLAKEDDLPGIAGVVAVLMEEDWWPDDLADTGYDALVSAVRLAVLQVAAGFQHATHEPTREEIDAAIKTVKDTAASMVHDAVKGAMSGWQLLWYGTIGNNDDTIGSEVWTANHEDLDEHPVIDFSRHWGSDEAGDGDWEISGSFTGVVPCPADALGGLLGRRRDGRMTAGIDRERAAPIAGALAAMREFRAGEYREAPGLERWWAEMQGVTPELVQAVSSSPQLGDRLIRLVGVLPGLLAAPDEPMEERDLLDVRSVLEELDREYPILGRAFARRALEVVGGIDESTPRAFFERLADVPPRGRGRPRSARE